MNQKIIEESAMQKIQINNMLLARHTLLKNKFIQQKKKKKFDEVRKSLTFKANNVIDQLNI